MDDVALPPITLKPDFEDLTLTDIVDLFVAKHPNVTFELRAGQNHWVRLTSLVTGDEVKFDLPIRTSTKKILHTAQELLYHLL